jgi:hypothetical protein
MTNIDELMALADEYANRKQWSSTQSAEQKRQELIAALEAALKPGEPVAWAVYWGFGLERKHSVHFSRETADMVAGQIKSVQKDVRPLYAAPPAQTQPPRLTDKEIGSIASQHWAEDGVDPIEFGKSVETAVRKQFGVNDE